MYGRPKRVIRQVLRLQLPVSLSLEKLPVRMRAVRNDGVLTMQFVNLGHDISIITDGYIATRSTVKGAHDIMGGVYFNIAPDGSTAPWLVKKTDLWFDHATWNCYEADVLRKR
jgi:hypothetical protein